VDSSAVAITTCCGRWEHARQSVLSWAADDQVSRVVFVDHGCPDGSGSRLEELWAHREPAASLTVVQVPRRGDFHKLRCINAGLREVIAGLEAHVLVLDVDDVRVAPLPPCEEWGLLVSSDVYGLLGTSRASLERLGPVTEAICGYGADDLYLRLWLLLAAGAGPVTEVAVGTFRALDHSEEEKVRFYSAKNTLVNNARNVAQLADMFADRFGVALDDDEALKDRFGVCVWRDVVRLCNESYSFRWRASLAAWRRELGL
jgi:hypothetical protein